jgi:hypothetical protein
MPPHPMMATFMISLLLRLEEERLEARGGATGE